MSINSRRILALAAATAIVLPTAALAQSGQDIDFGDDSSEWAGDGECDDARFVGDGVADSLVTENIGRDASDCKAKFDEGSAALNPLFAQVTDSNPIDFGDNSSEYANNDVCDDVRFTGAYAAEVIYIVDDIGSDANDCRTAYESGDATWQGNETQPNNGISVEDLLGGMTS